MGLGWGRNQSLVKDIAGADFLYLGQVFIGSVAKVGYPLGVVRGYGFIRCGISSTDTYPFLLNATNGCVGKKKGTLYVDDGSNCSTQPGMPCGDDDPRI